MVPRRKAVRAGTSDRGAMLSVSGGRAVLDERAFEEMVLTYAQPLTAFAWRYVQSDDVAADLVQDVFAHVWEHRDALDVRVNLRAYLFAATRNRALNALEHARIEARWREGVVREGAAHDPAPAESAERAERTELRGAVEAALQSLPPRAQEIARLRFLDRLSRREIAEVLGIAVPTVSVHLVRTVKRLRALLRGFAE